MAARLYSATSGAAGERHAGAVVVDRFVRRWLHERADGPAAPRTGPRDPASSMGTYRLPAPRRAVRLRPTTEPEHGVLHTRPVGQHQLPAIHTMVRRRACAGVG